MRSLLGKQKARIKGSKKIAGAHLGCKMAKTHHFILAGEVSRKRLRIVKNCEGKENAAVRKDCGIVKHAAALLLRLR